MGLYGNPKADSDIFRPILLELGFHLFAMIEQAAELGFIGRNRLQPRPQAWIADSMGLWRHSGCVLSQFGGGLEQVGDISQVKDRARNQLDGAADEGVIDVGTDPELADQLVGGQKSGGNGFRQLRGQFRVVFMRRDKNSGKVKRLGKRRKFARRQAAGHGPDFHFDAGANLFVNQSAGREGGVVQMRGNVDPSHGIFLP